MKQFDLPQDLRTWSDKYRVDGLTIGFVPTMGALHQGHISLIKRARQECDLTVISIFVNPSQFGPNEDFDRYPRPLEDDIALCQREKVNALFLPSVETMYPQGNSTVVSVGSSITTEFEGKLRPGHFVGVATIVAKLLVIVKPSRVYFGRKDAQQCSVVRRLVADLTFDAEIVVCPVVRDKDGLALSSRNVYLTKEQRQQALAIPAALEIANKLFENGVTDSRALVEAAYTKLAESPELIPDYVAIVDPVTFQPVNPADTDSEIIFAGKIGATRLLDAMRLGVDKIGLIVRAMSV